MSDDEDEIYGYGDGDDYGGDSDEEWVDEIRQTPTYVDTLRTGSGVVPCWITDRDGAPLKTQTPLGRFCLAVDAISRKINDSGPVDLDNSRIQTLLYTSRELPLVEYKNPTAFILGYIATAEGKRNITKTSLNLAWRCYQAIADNKNKSVQKPDIIRYARYWMGSK